jgi:hypothetical protein
MSEDDTDRYREQAEYCRLQAKNASSPKDQEAWLKIAGDWLQMAEDAERRRQGP